MTYNNLKVESSMTITITSSLKKNSEQHQLNCWIFIFTNEDEYIIPIFQVLVFYL